MLNVGVRSQYVFHIQSAKGDLLDIEGLLDVGGNEIVIAVPATWTDLLWCLRRQLG
jgi:hypothetical protein